MACTPFATGRSIDTGPASAGSVFKATANDGPVGTSPVWHGGVSPMTPPSVSGSVQANALVTPVAGTWSGGWDGDYDLTQLAACVGAGGTECTTLTNQNYTNPCPNGAAVIDPAFTGDYLRVADERVARDTAFATYAVGSPYGGRVWTAGPTVSVAMLGQIAPATGPRAANCGPPPIAIAVTSPPPNTAPKTTAPPKAEPPAACSLTTCPLFFAATLSKRGVATVHCAGACTITLLATRGRRHAHLERKLTKSQNMRLQFSKRSLKRLGRGPITVTVLIDGTIRAKRTITA